MRILFIITVLLSIFTNTSYAEELNAQQVISTSADKVLAAIRVDNSDTPENIKKLSVTLLELLEPVVDFDSISKAVMGKYKKVVTIDQKERFTPIFKKTLTHLYAKSLIKFNIVKIQVLPSTNKDESKKKDNVSMEVTTDDGKTYSIIYTMRKNKENKWRVRNIVLDGINLGLTYRNQFNSATLSYNGDVDQTIANWSGEMDL
jgi:phospholipid transport system substrate-binding protein